MNRKRVWSAALAAIVVVVIAGVLLWSWDGFGIRSRVKWLTSSQQYKSAVLAQPAGKGQFQHVEWDSWGWAGQDTTVYLVFDPSDSLSASATAAGPQTKHDGLPCEVAQVRRLERQWYTIQFYTDEDWDNCTRS